MNEEAIFQQLLNAPVPQRHLDSWCAGCRNQVEAARRYNIDMSNFFEYCAGGGPIAQLSIDDQNKVVKAAIATQIFAKEEGVYNGEPDGKIGPNTIQAIEELGANTPLNNIIFFNRFDPNQPCPLRRDIEPPIAPEPTPKKKDSNIGIIAGAAIVAAGAYYLLRKRK